jgi:hypothetical protein
VGCENDPADLGLDDAPVLNDENGERLKNHFPKMTKLNYLTA